MAAVTPGAGGDGSELESLPFIDEYAEATTAPADVVWTALLRVLRGQTRGSARLARVLGCDPVEGTPGFAGRLAESVPGFRVVESEPGRRLALRGRHRFARYALTFLIDGGQLRARTEAAFPGVRGRMYRALLLRTGAHQAITRKLLKRIARAAGPARP